MNNFSKLLCLFLICTASVAHGAGIMTVGQDEGYSGMVLDKLARKWSPPPQLKGNHRLRIVISVDGNGELIDCKVKKPSGLEALDASVCAAARAVAPFGSPPYGMPAELYFSLWSGSPDGRAPDDPASPGADTSIARLESARAAEANERARARAEALAQTQGKQLKKAAKKPDIESKPKPQQNSPAPAVAKSDVNAATNNTNTAKDKIPSTETANTAAKTRHGAIPKAQDKYDEKYDKYISSVVWKLRNAMYVPGQTRPGLYYATAGITFDKSGKILSASVIDGSGDALLDKYMIQGIKRAGKIAPPPEGLGDSLDLTFTFVRK